MMAEESVLNRDAALSLLCPPSNGLRRYLKRKKINIHGIAITFNPLKTPFLEYGTAIQEAGPEDGKYCRMSRAPRQRRKLSNLDVSCFISANQLDA